MTTHVTWDPLTNYGNFLALLQFRIQAGDEVLKKHLQTAQGNALYTSITIQNEMISIYGNLIRHKILKSVRDAHFFLVIVDEATDAANLKQLSISVRFVSKEEICEKYLGLLKCETGVSGAAIAENILSQLNTWQLLASLLRGQGYNGADLMSGHSRGTAAHISAMYPKAYMALIHALCCTSAQSLLS